MGVLSSFSTRAFYARSLPPDLQYLFRRMAFYLGIDGGGSKTAALVTDENGAACGRGLAGGSNHLRVGIETATGNIVRAVNIALVESGLAIREIEYAYCGIAGSDHPEHHERVVDSLKT